MFPNYVADVYALHCIPIATFNIVAVVLVKIKNLFCPFCDFFEQDVVVYNSNLFVCLTDLECLSLKILCTF